MHLDRMMPQGPGPRYAARTARSAADLRAAQELRALAFGTAGRPDGDSFDAPCTHFLIEDRESGRLVCCFRVLPLPDGRALDQSYAAQFYDLGRLELFDAPMMELGRFCLHPQARDPDILRMAWAALTRHVDSAGVRMLFGCASFRGMIAERYRHAFDLLGARYLAPLALRPRIKAPHVIRYAAQARDSAPDPRSGLAQMPPLLRSYLAMGGWVSDHAVVDPAMNTLHVFTGLEIAAIPPVRQRVLRAAARMLDGAVPAR